MLLIFRRNEIEIMKGAKSFKRDRGAFFDDFIDKYEFSLFVQNEYAIADASENFFDAD